MAGHLLVTNDFPPKVGGIQSYLWELWRRLPPEETTVLTTPHAGAAEFDSASPIRIVRTRQPVLLPTASLARRIRGLADEVGAQLVVLDPALPLGTLGLSLRLPYALVLHGAEVTVPGRLPVSQHLLASVVRNASLLIAAGPYPAEEIRRLPGVVGVGAAGVGAALPPVVVPPVVVVPPGVDAKRFRPLTEDERRAARTSFGLPADAPLVVSVSRLVPRKGMDVLIRACRELSPRFPGLTLAIAGAGRDRIRLAGLAALAARPGPRTPSSTAVHLLGRVPDTRLPDLYGCADVFAMLCRDRWFGLEQEGFGIVFLEAAACGVPQVAGASGGAPDAVADGETGIIVRQPRNVPAVAGALGRLLGDGDLRGCLGAAARTRARQDYDYDRLAARLRSALHAALNAALHAAPHAAIAEPRWSPPPPPPEAG